MPDGTVAEDPSGKLCGRGAYVCRNEECIDKVNKRRLLSRALRTNSKIELKWRVNE